MPHARAQNLQSTYANQKAGATGKHYILDTKSLAGTWGTGSKKAVSLIFDDKVCAIMGSCDGGNAHLIEQVATKSRVVFLSAWSGDPTLSKAFIPWFFNCVPNYNQQADILIEEIYKKRKLWKIAIISDIAYDSKSARDSFKRRLLVAGKTEPLEFVSSTDNAASISAQLKKKEIEVLILFGTNKNSRAIIDNLKAINYHLQIFGTTTLLNEENFQEKDFTDINFVSPDAAERPEAIAFRKEYQKSYGSVPGVVAKLAFDGMNLLIQATGNTNFDRETIQKALLKIKSEGVTGTIKFDDKGNRIGVPYIIKIKDGVQIPVEKY